MTDRPGGDVSTLSLEGLRERRTTLQATEDTVSYARRVAQARLDLLRRHRDDPHAPLADALRDVLEHQAVTPSNRPPRDVSAHESAPIAVELDELCARHGFSRLDQLGTGELDALIAALEEFEGRVSAQRRDLLDEIDGLERELVNRYRDGGVRIDSLWAPDEDEDEDEDEVDDAGDVHPDHARDGDGST